MKKSSLIGLSCAAVVALAVGSAQAASPAAVYSVTVDGPDAIFLAGRTDITIPAAGVAWGGLNGLDRHPLTEALEQFPDFITIEGGDIIRALDPAIGGVNFFPGPDTNGYFGPGGNGSSGSSLTSLGGISGYIGPQGPLTGVFLDDSVPNGTAPATLNFSPSGLGTDFTQLTPGIGQVFYIGDGKTSGGDFQKFIAPAGATRLFLGIPDGFGFGGHPGAYDDNNGTYTVRIGVNQVPTNNVPDGGTVLPVLAAALGTLAWGQRRLRSKS